jgi:hypothetical protein
MLKRPKRRYYSLTAVGVKAVGEAAQISSLYLEGLRGSDDHSRAIANGVSQVNGGSLGGALARDQSHWAATGEGCHGTESSDRKADRPYSTSHYPSTHNRRVKIKTIGRMPAMVGIADLK